MSIEKSLLVEKQVCLLTISTVRPNQIGLMRSEITLALELKILDKAFQLKDEIALLISGYLSTKFLLRRELVEEEFKGRKKGKSN